MTLSKPIFLAPIVIPTTGVYLRINGSTDVTLAAGSYYWQRSEAAGGSLNDLLADALNLATTGTWHVEVETFAGGRNVVITQDSGSPAATSLVFTDPAVIGPYVLGYSTNPAATTITVTAGVATSPYQPQGFWEPDEYILDDTITPIATTVVARSISGAAIIDDYGEWSQRELRLEAVDGARVWQWAADDSAFAAAAGVIAGDPHAALESFWRYCRTGPAADGVPLQLRYYRATAWDAGSAPVATLEWSDPEQLRDLRTAVEQVSPGPLLYRVRLRTREV